MKMVIIGVGRGKNQEAALYKQEATKNKPNPPADALRTRLTGTFVAQNRS